MTYRQFDREFTKTLLAKAEKSERRRAHFNVHEDYNEPVHRLYVGMLADSYVRPHRHTDKTKWEFFMVVQGSITLVLFDENARVTDKLSLTAGGECFSVQLPPGTWHATYCEEPVVFFEVKQGPYKPEADKNFAAWAPEEGDDAVVDFLAQLQQSKVGDVLSQVSR
ncbi:WbuC family cupin fold metalloprotein [Alteromonas halophila]|uniref:Cupin fold metalloprotein WbuC cupin domain-containing protein n=1 Tax=Alteromonas halophila TaxID=516698 RepID=A0A918JEJ7_9ALTE|nr:WbuC family cupin fold metalloprotein [Alteromonas halophila]GGW76893.1 hypothetical protein GCM10007391_07200 [Alteromonas halophila]